MCDCISLTRAATLLNVRAKLLAELAHAGHVEHHRHGDRYAITRNGLADLRWQLLTSSEGDAA